MLLWSLMLVALEDPAAVKQDARCAAVMLVVGDSVGSGTAEESAAAAATAYYVGKLQGYYATVPQMALAPMSAFDRTRNAVLDASRTVEGLDRGKLQSDAKACYQAYERTLDAL